MNNKRKITNYRDWLLNILMVNTYYYNNISIELKFASFIIANYIISKHFEMTHLFRLQISLLLSISIQYHLLSLFSILFPSISPSSQQTNKGFLFHQSSFWLDELFPQTSHWFIENYLFFHSLFIFHLFLFIIILVFAHFILSYLSNYSFTIFIMIESDTTKQGTKYEVIERLGSGTCMKLFISNASLHL